MPRPKKRPGEAVDRRNGDRLTLVPTQQPASGIPAPPPGLLRSSVNTWNGFWASDVARIAGEGDHPLVQRWIGAVDEHARALSAFKRERMVAGSTGQPRLNPLEGWIKSREAVIQAAEDRLGLSPLARMRLGVAVGDAHRSLADLNAAFLDGDTDEPGDDADEAIVSL